MPRRLWIVLLTVCCGLVTSAPPVAAQERQKGVSIWYSLAGKDPTLKPATLTVVNQKPHKKKTGIVILVGMKKIPETIDLDEVEQLQFDPKNSKNDKVIFTDKKKQSITGEIISSFSIEDARVYESADLGIILFPHKKTTEIVAEPSSGDASTRHPEPKSPPLFPFWDLPKVTMISGSASCKFPKQCTLEECARKEHLFTWIHRFKTAVHFPQPRFSDAGDRHDTPGTAIYEGMQIVVASDGRYEVAFNATTPRIPVTLRLQLSVCVVGHEPIMVSLPAISMTPEYRDAESDYGRSNRVLSNNFQQNWHVRHIGFSPELASAVCLPGCLVVVQRDGVARFGSLPLSR